MAGSRRRSVEAHQSGHAATAPLSASSTVTSPRATAGGGSPTAMPVQTSRVATTVMMITRRWRSAARLAADRTRADAAGGATTCVVGVIARAGDGGVC